MSVAEKRTQVYFPLELHRKIEKKAKKESKSSSAIIREAVAQYLEKEKEKEIDWENDPIFKLAGIMKSGVGDLSVNHDYYLYGMKKKACPRLRSGGGVWIARTIPRSSRRRAMTKSAGQ